MFLAGAGARAGAGAGGEQDQQPGKVSSLCPHFALTFRRTALRLLRHQNSAAKFRADAEASGWGALGQSACAGLLPVTARKQNKAGERERERREKERARSES